jgi:hemerythrin-like metal-binding protein
MPLMQWSEEMSVGIDELDEDHKQLIAIINRLAENRGKASRVGVVRQCLLALRRYAELHFAREERVMRACDYPMLSGHSATHKAFVARVREVNARFEAAPEAEARAIDKDLLDYLTQWLKNHILHEDMAYRPYAEGNPRAREAARSFQGVEVWWSD